VKEHVAVAVTGDRKAAGVPEGEMVADGHSAYIPVNDTL
jgi:hypothetical protein